MPLSSVRAFPSRCRKPNWILPLQRRPSRLQQKLYDSRKELFQQGALPRRDLDSAQVALAQARSQYQQAQKQLDDLKNLGEKQALKSAGRQLSAMTGKYRGAEAQLSYSEIRSPINGVVTDRPALCW